MTSEAGARPTRIRPRLTAAPAGEPSRVTSTLSPAARAGLDRIAGSRPVEELVVFAAAALLVTAAMEHTSTPAVVVCGPAGPTVVRVDVAGTDTLADVVRAVDAALRSARPSTAAVPDLAEAVAVRSDRVPSPAPTAVGAIDLTLAAPRDGDDGGVTAMVAGDLAASWFAEVLLRSVATALTGFRSPDTPPAEAPFADPADLAVAETLESGRFATTPRGRTMLDPIAEAARTRPDAVAVVSGDRTLRYGELWRDATAVATRLRALGIGAGDRVVVLTGKNPHAVPAILGTLLARAAYVPLDPRWPAARVAMILDDVDCQAIVADASLRHLLPDVSASVVVLDPAELVDGAAAGAESEFAGPQGDDLGYIVYTSGSTGTPKGVLIRHRAVAGYLAWKVDYHGLDAETRLLQTASLAVDGGTSDVFSVLAAGGSLVLVDMHATQARELGELARRHAITHVNTVPTLYRVVLDELATAAEHLRLVTLAGEASTPDLVRRHHEALPRVRLVNEYGPTECSIAATAFDHDLDAGPGCPIGHPIPNTVVTVGDTNGRRRPPGFVGELRLSGHGLADGYRNRPEQTAAVFVDDPSVPGDRCYRSGDLGWWRPDGMLEFVGRDDDQVKIRGQRVELGEVERVLGDVSGVRTVAVVAATDPNGELGLVAFAETVDLTGAQLRSAATELLPPAMVPARVELVDTLPTMASGKPDRTVLVVEAERLLKTSLTGADGDGVEVSGVERVVAEVFGEVFGGEPAGADDDFFVLGGHSLMAVSVIGKLEERLGVMLDLDGFLEAATVAKVAELLRQGGATDEAGEPTATATEPESTPMLPIEDSDSLLNLIAEAEAPAAAEPVASRAAESDRVAALRGLFAVALELDEELITDDTDFFLVGGHSLSALNLVVAIEAEFGVPVGIRAIFDAPTPVLLAARLAETPAVTRPPGTETSADEADAVLGAESRSLWLERQRGETEPGAYTVPCLFDVDGDLDLERLRRAVTAVGNRHPILRTVFTEDRGGPRPRVAFDHLDLEVVDTGADRDDPDAWQAVVDDRAYAQFDPRTGPLFRLSALRHRDGHWSLLLVADHLVCDGRGLEVLARDLVRAYSDPAGLPPAPAARRRPETEPDLAYWRSKLTPAPRPLALPVTDARSGPVTTVDTVFHDLEPAVVAALRATAHDARAGEYVPFAAAVMGALADLTGSRDVCVGTPVDRRVKLGVPDEAGFHVATVPLRVTVPPEADALLSAVTAAALDAVDHSGVPFGELVAELDPPRHAWRPPYFDVWVALYPRIEVGDADRDGIALRGGPLPLRYGMFELSYQFVATATGVQLQLQYDTRRYRPEVVRRLAAGAVTSLERLAGVATEQPRPAAETVFGGFNFD